MNKKNIITILLALVAVAGQAKTFKTIKNPVAMACVNVSNGELKARRTRIFPWLTSTGPHDCISKGKTSHPYILQTL